MANNPTLLSMPIAENGTKNTIPETQATPGNGLMSQSTGFPAECSLPLGAGGVAPDRADFNGVFNLLSGVAFMAQKGFTFNYDATQDYYNGCVVIDNGNRYLCVADMPAGTVAPSADTAGNYWILSPIGVINKRDVITASGTYTAPVTGWYKITVKGGGGGGAAGGVYGTQETYSGGGGGEGGISIGYEKMAAGDTATVVIGAGGAGGASGNAAGTAGGNSTATVNSNTYTGGGGGGGTGAGGAGGTGGTGTIPGAPGCTGYINTASNSASIGGGSGGGNGGGIASRVTGSTAGTNGCGGGGGGSYTSAQFGSAGGDGYAWFEYFAAI